MSNNQRSGQLIRTNDGQSTGTEEKKQWANFRIIFHLVSPTFPNNKIYGQISIKPDSARKIIEHFQLFIDDHQRAQFPSTFDDISIGGFNRKTDKSINVRITAIPRDSTLKPKSSKSCNFDFTGHNFGINPIFHFKWIENKATVIIRWQHVVDQTIEKYILLLDEREIHYVYRREFQPEFEFFIHDLEPNTSHTLQIIGKIKKAKRDCQSDVIHFTTPESEDALNHEEVLHVQQENVPHKLKAYIDINSEEEEEEAIEQLVSTPEPRSFRNIALELLEKLRRQIEERNHRCQ